MAEKKKVESKNVISVDPDLFYKRMLHYKEKHSGWEIYKAVYWGIYIFVIGIFTLTLYNTQMIIGYSLAILSIFVIVFGFASSLHLKLIKAYG